jgi:hypothetical protein
MTPDLERLTPQPTQSIWAGLFFRHDILNLQSQTRNPAHRQAFLSWRGEAMPEYLALTAADRRPALPSLSSSLPASHARMNASRTFAIAAFTSVKRSFAYLNESSARATQLTRPPSTNSFACANESMASVSESFPGVSQLTSFQKDGIASSGSEKLTRAESIIASATPGGRGGIPC